MSTKRGKEAILKFCQRACQERGVEVKNLSTSFADGLAFAAIVDSQRPELLTNMGLTFKTIQDDFGRVERLQWAFDQAEQLGIPRLLDPEDIDPEKPDERSIITYLSAVYKFFKENAGSGAASSEQQASETTSAATSPEATAAETTPIEQQSTTEENGATSTTEEAVVVEPTAATAEETPAAVVEETPVEPTPSPTTEEQPTEETTQQPTEEATVVEAVVESGTNELVAEKTELTDDEKLILQDNTEVHVDVVTPQPSVEETFPSSLSTTASAGGASIAEEQSLSETKSDSSSDSEEEESVPVVDKRSPRRVTERVASVVSQVTATTPTRDWSFDDSDDEDNSSRG
ncbi:calponin homology domain protein, partial [Naegleria gruberi]